MNRHRARLLPFKVRDIPESERSMVMALKRVAWRADCSCGWRGRSRPTRNGTLQYFYGHLDEL